MIRPQFDRRAPGPSPDAIRQARAAAGHSQSQAARMAYATLRSWQAWEAGERVMPRAMFVLYLLRTGQAALDELDD